MLWLDQKNRALAFSAPLQTHVQDYFIPALYDVHMARSKQTDNLKRVIKSAIVELIEENEGLVRQILVAVQKLEIAAFPARAPEPAPERNQLVYAQAQAQV